MQDNVAELTLEERLAELHEIEKLIVVLMKQSSIALKALIPDQQGDVDVEGFKFGAERYALVLQTVSMGLRKHFRHLATSGIEQIEHLTPVNDLKARELHVAKLEELVGLLRQEKQRRAVE